MTTVLEHLRTIARVTECRRVAGHAMTYAAGQELLRHATDLVYLAETVDDFLSGDAPKDALMAAFRPMLSSAEESAHEAR